MNLPLLVNVNILASSRWWLVSQGALHRAKAKGRRECRGETGGGWVSLLTRVGSFVGFQEPFKDTNVDLWSLLTESMG